MISIIDIPTSVFRHNFTTSFVVVILIVGLVFSVGSQCSIRLFSVQEALNILILMAFMGIALKSYQLFKKEKV